LIFTVSFDEESIVCQEYENEVDVTGETCGYGIVFDSDSAWVNIVGCEQEPGEEILTIEKWVKPNCHDDLWEKSISFNYSDYEYVTYRVDIHVNDSFSEPIFDLQIRDNLPQLNGLRYNESYMRRIIGENEEEPYYNYDMEIMDDFIYWQFNDEIYPGSTFSLYYCADVIACGTFENWVNVTGFYYDGGPCCPVDVFVNDSATVDVICGSGIDVTKEASLDGETWSSDGVNSYLDDTIWFRLTVKNIGFETLEGVNVHDYLPDFLEFNEMIDDGDADHVFTDCENETWDLRWFFTELAIGEEVQIIFTADVTKVKNGNNVVTVSSCGGPGSSDSVDIVVDEGMFVEKKASLNGEDWSENITVSSGETVSWKVTIDYLNSNNSCILHHLSLWDILPEELTYVDDSAVVKLHDGTSYFMNPEIDDDVLIWDLDDEFLLNGGWIKVTFDTLVDSDAFGEIENEVNVTGRVCDGKYYEVTDSAIAYVSSGNLASCEKLVRRNSGDAWVDEIDANLDEEISFKITLTNTGFGAMNHINIEDDLPDELEYIQDSSELYFDGEIVSCEPLLVGETLVWEDICTCIPNENSEEEARYLLVDETVSITFDVRTLSSGTAINQMSIDAKMCENAVQVSCSDDATVNIEIDPLIADAGNSYSGYVNDEIQFLGSATGGIPDYSYNWDLDDDDEFDDSTLQNPTQTWTEAGSYTVSLKVVDDSGSNDTDSATVIIEDREPNLYCSGSITFTDIEPGSTQTATITVENTGDPGSKLDWSILDEPTWGEWTFSPSDGNDLTPEEGDQTIDVTIVVPDEKNEEFSGTITFVNDDDSSDTCDVTVSVATPHNNQHPFLRLLNNLIERFPFLDWLVETFSS
ncbi:MAG TPA: PKD domain-containing protein, partial [Candidatus Thermoplasmatota archaeon]|nr:PKD domain-containing protein [Candidatus Thermoplasmatota archaeon]